MWGRAIAYSVFAFKHRDTPTCVGKRICKSFLSVGLGGHPHVCGEEFIFWRASASILGTPPRVWGRVYKVTKQSSNEGTPPRVWGRVLEPSLDCMSFGDTPTCVGKRIFEVFKRHGRKGHPHVCGEELLRRLHGLTAGGTPPRVWGRVMASPSASILSRDTPTCVGKSIADTAYTNTG